MITPLGESGMDHVTVRLKGLSCETLIEFGGESGSTELLSNQVVIKAASVHSHKF